MPPTILTEDPDIAVAAVRSYGQAVAKPLFTSKARGMKIISAALPNIKDKILEFKSLGNNVLYIQKMIPHSRPRSGSCFSQRKLCRHVRACEQR